MKLLTRMKVCLTVTPQDPLVSMKTALGARERPGRSRDWTTPHLVAETVPFFVTSRGKNSDGSILRVDDPMLLHTHPVVEIPPCDQIAMASSWRKDLHNQVGRRVTRLCVDDMEPILGDENDAGNQEIIRPQPNAGRG